MLTNKSIITIVLILAVFTAQINSQNNCRFAVGNRCVVCNTGYTRQNDGTCLKQTQSSNSPNTTPIILPPIQNTTIPNANSNQRTVPCKGKQYCGQAKTYGSKQSLINQLKKIEGQRQKNTGPLGFEIQTVAPIANTDSSKISSSSFTPSHSQTNNQVQSVDEADIIKTDGNYIYSISRCVLSIIKSFPYNNAKVVSTVKFTQQPEGLFIQGNNLAVFGTSYTPNVNTYIYIYDVSNRANPILRRSFKIQGSYFQARKSQKTGYMYILTRHYLNLNDPDGNPIPYYNIGFGNQDIPYQNIYLYPDAADNLVFINIASIDLVHPLGAGSGSGHTHAYYSSPFKIVSIITQGGYIIYASDYNIYFTYTKYNYQIYGNQQQTVIHAIYIDKQLMIPYADGKVPGYINNQFFMDQYKFDLRIATTQNSNQFIPINNGNQLTIRPPPPSTSNNVFVLRYSFFSQQLQIIGQVRNIAVGQRIYSCRFVGPKLYMVTFRRVDPFFVIDLEYPSAPVILGQLKIPGYSTYLHPYDQNTIIGVGRDANDQGVAQGLKIALFDVSNVASPQLLTSFALEQKYVYSNAQFEHKAFLFDRQKQLLVIPASYNDFQHNNANTFNGAFVFRITRYQIYNPVIVDHLNGDNGVQFYYKRFVERSLYVEDVLFTKSPCKLRLHLLPSVLAIKDINLDCCETQDPPNQIGGFIKT